MAGKLIQTVVAWMLLGSAVTTATAQDSLLSELYGQGVHSYFSGDAEKAHEVLTMAIDQGSRDPRCFYFRGLAHNKLGRPEEGEADFKRGAELEAAGEAVQIDIGSSLQRIQGATRLQLESLRYQARLSAQVTDVKQRQERYEEFQRDEPRVIRGPDAGANVKLPVTPPAPLSDDPFGSASGGAAAPIAPTTTPPAAPVPSAGIDEASDPFADPAVPVVIPPEGAEPPAAVDPADLFGAPGMPAPAAGDPADPFGAPAAPGADPFGAPAAPAAPDDDLFGAPAAPMAPGADLFGAPAAPAAPAAPDDDLFGTPPAPAAPGADPFGAPPEPPAPGAPGADPFGAPPEPAAPGAPGADPFGAPPEPPAPAAPGADPFGAPPEPAAPGADPFGAPAAPADDSDLLGGDDPFANPPGPEPGMDEDAADEAMPPEAEEAADPFGDDPPENAGANDDPFAP